MELVTAVYYINWTEYESGWGQRPDGVSIHRSQAEAFRFKNMIEDKGSYDYYSRGSHPILVEATPVMVDLLKDNDSAWLQVNGNI